MPGAIATSFWEVSWCQPWAWCSCLPWGIFSLNTFDFSRQTCTWGWCLCVALSFLMVNSLLKKAGNGDKDYRWHCADLFSDLVTLFRKLMMTMAVNEKDKKKEKWNDHPTFPTLTSSPTTPCFLFVHSAGGLLCDNEKNQKKIALIYYYIYIYTYAISTW